jgi:tripartite-type tricarboxylate transporter receptor subunit TctC
MKLRRRQFLDLAMGVAAFSALPRAASALDYPTRPVRLILSFPAGGPNDVVGRLLGQCLSERLGRPFIIENRSGAGGTVGTEVVVRAAPDGYTLLQVNTPNAINATLYDNLTYNFMRDIAPVASIIRTPLVMEVSPSFPTKTVPEFIAYAKANPGKINKMMAGVSMVRRGGALALTDLLGGQVQGLIDPIPASIGYLRAGSFVRWP